jgi:hypothetical protein
MGSAERSARHAMQGAPALKGPGGPCDVPNPSLSSQQLNLGNKVEGGRGVYVLV